MQLAVTIAEVADPAVMVARAPSWAWVGLFVIGSVVLTAIARRAMRAPALERWQRWFNPLVASAWMATTWICARRLIVGPTTAEVAARSVVVLVLLAIIAPVLRDILAAAVLSFEGRHRLGDDVRVGAHEGRIVEFGLRSVVLRRRDGTESTIPNHRFLAADVDRLNLSARDAPCEFEVVIPAGEDVESSSRKLLEAALLSPLAAPGSLPEVFVVADRGGELRLRVRAYVFDRAYEERYRGDILARMHLSRPG
jgi:small-conductance mechanosensitive channel